MLLLELQGAHSTDHLAGLYPLLFTLLEDFFCIRPATCGCGCRSREARRQFGVIGMTAWAFERRAKGNAKRIKVRLYHRLEREREEGETYIQSLRLISRVVHHRKVDIQHPHLCHCHKYFSYCQLRSLSTPSFLLLGGSNSRSKIFETTATPPHRSTRPPSHPGTHPVPSSSTPLHRTRPTSSPMPSQRAIARQDYCRGEA